MKLARWFAEATIPRNLPAVFALFALIALPGVAQGALSSDDRFDGSALNWCQWEEASYKGRVAQSGELSLSPEGTDQDQFSMARVLSQARVIGDFDMQVDYRFGAGFELPPTSGGLDISIGMYWDDTRHIELGRVRIVGGDGVHATATLPGLASNNSLFANEVAQAGRLRLVRTGSQLNFYFQTLAALSWTSLGTLSVPTTPAHITLTTSNSGTLRSVTGYVDNFKLNTGATDDIEYTQPATFNRRPDFAVGAFVENYPAHRYWRGGWKPADFFDFARDNGLQWAKTSATMLSAPELIATPPQQWGSLSFQPNFWSSREWAAETLRQAAARGLRQEVQLLLSPGAAFWGTQGAPSDWASKTPDEIVPLLEQNVFETVSYFKSQGLNVELYALGNEIDIGILDFLPNRRITVPGGVNFTTDLGWLRGNVWPIEAKLLAAAAAGVKRADAAAKIMLHIAGLEYTPGNILAPAFFQAMRDLGVPFDYAALSHPYAYFPSKLDQYPKACWFKRLALAANRINEAAGKPVMFVEASYPSAPGSGILSAPMPDFPYTESGQAAWIREQLRFASSRPNVAGWHYFYPDMTSNLIGPSAEEQTLESSSLFVKDQEPRPGLFEFRVNLNGTSGNYNYPVVEYFNPALDHYFITWIPNEIATLDAGIAIKGWARTGYTFQTKVTPQNGTSPVCRYYIPPGLGNSHFFGRGTVECDATGQKNPSFVLEDSAFMQQFLPTAGVCPSNTTEVYRVFDNRPDANHRYMTDKNVQAAMVAKGWVPEGDGPDLVVMCAPQ